MTLLRSPRAGNGRTLTVVERQPALELTIRAPSATQRRGRTAAATRHVRHRAPGSVRRPRMPILPGPTGSAKAQLRPRKRSTSCVLAPAGASPTRTSSCAAAPSSRRGPPSAARPRGRGRGAGSAPRAPARGGRGKPLPRAPPTPSRRRRPPAPPAAATHPNASPSNASPSNGLPSSASFARSASLGSICLDKRLAAQQEPTAVRFKTFIARRVVSGTPTDGRRRSTPHPIGWFHGP